MRIFSNDRLTGLQRLSQGIEALRSLLMRADSGDPGEAGDDNSGERTIDAMTDLQRFGLALIGFAVAVVVCGVLLGLVGSWITKKRGSRR